MSLNFSVGTELRHLVAAEPSEVLPAPPQHTPYCTVKSQLFIADCDSNYTFLCSIPVSIFCKEFSCCGGAWVSWSRGYSFSKCGYSFGLRRNIF